MHISLYHHVIKTTEIINTIIFPIKITLIGKIFVAISKKQSKFKFGLLKLNSTK